MDKKMDHTEEVTMEERMEREYEEMLERTADAVLDADMGENDEHVLVYEVEQVKDWDFSYDTKVSGHIEDPESDEVMYFEWGFKSIFDTYMRLKECPFTRGVPTYNYVVVTGVIKQEKLEDGEEDWNPIEETVELLVNFNDVQEIVDNVRLNGWIESFALIGLEL